MAAYRVSYAAFAVSEPPMNDRETVRQILQSAGPRDDAILEVLQTGDDAWAVRYADVDIDLELEPNTRRLMFSSEIGKLPEGGGEEICRILLTYSLLWRETGGLRMALTEPKGSLVQLVDIHCGDLTAELAVAVLHNLNDRTLLWRDFIAGDPSEAIPPSTPVFPMIQV